MIEYSLDTMQPKLVSKTAMVLVQPTCAFHTDPSLSTVCTDDCSHSLIRVNWPETNRCSRRTVSTKPCWWGTTSDLPLDLDAILYPANSYSHIPPLPLLLLETLPLA